MNLNSLRNFLTIIFGVGGVGISAIFPNINPVLGLALGLWVRAIMDEFWPATGIVKDWKNSLRNLLTVLLASGDVFHTYLPFLPAGTCATLSLILRAVMDQVWPATPVVSAPKV